MKKVFLLLAMTLSITLSYAQTLVIDSQTDCACNGGNDGAVTVSASGGTAPYTYEWDNGLSSDSNQVDLVAGIYIVTVTDDDSNTDQLSVTILEPDILAINFDQIIMVSCNGGDDGRMTVSASGGAGSYTWVWADSQTNSVIENLVAGDYYVTVTDANNCQFSAVDNITQPDIININLSNSLMVSCFGGTEGMLNIGVDGGVPGYTYEWSNGATQDSITDLSAGGYTLTVTDANGCQKIWNGNVAEPDSIIISENDHQNISCFGGNEGILSTSVNGGVPGYTYEWSNGATEDSISNLIAGEYTLTVTDANGCQGSWLRNVTEPSLLVVITDSEINPSSSGASDGYINLHAEGGTSSYTYDWSNGSVEDSISNLIADTYIVNVTDANGCSVIDSIVLMDPENTEANIIDYSFVEQVTPFTSNGIDSIFIEVAHNTDLSSLVATYTLSMGATAKVDTLLQESGVTVNDFTNPLTYFVTSENEADTLNWIISVTLSEDTGIIINPDVINIDCYGQPSGIIFTSVEGGSSPYTYNWTGPNNFFSSDSVVLDLIAGMYYLTVTDDNLSSVVDSFMVIEPEPILIRVIEKVNPSSVGASDGQIRIDVVGGNSPYTYNWSNGDSTINAFNLQEGIHTININDIKACEAMLSISLKAPSLNSGTEILTYGFDEQYGQAFFDKPNGIINAEVVHGTDLTSLVALFLLSEGATAKIDTVLQESEVTSNDFTSELTYIVTAENGVDSQDWKVNVLEKEDTTFAVAGILNNIMCNGNADGRIKLSINGGASPYTYNWTGPNSFVSSDSIIVDLTPGTYYVTVTDNNSIEVTQSFFIVEPSALIAIIPPVASCTGACNAQATVFVNGGFVGYTYSWSNLENSTSATITDLCIDSTYSVTVTDANFCVTTATVTILQSPSEIQITDNEVINVSCPGADNGSIDVFVSGGIGSYTYLWSNGATTQDIINLGVDETVDTTIYKLIVTDANGCKAFHSVDISQYELPDFEVQTTGSTCGSSNGAANINGIAESHTTIWSNGIVGDVVYGLAPGTYSVLVKFDGDCFSTKYFQIADGNITVVENVTNTSCENCNDGSINLNLSGGTAPYIVLWSNGVVDINNNNLFTGSYSAVITDVVGCINNICVQLTKTQNLTASIMGTNASDCGLADGSAQVNVLGGTAPYTYVWSENTGNQTTMLVNNLSAGVYYCTISDASGTSITTSIAIGDNERLHIETINKEASVCGQNTGLVNVEVFGGSGNYSYLWSNGKTTQDILGVSINKYHLLVTDGTCKSAFNTEIFPELPLVQQICMVTVDTVTNHNLIVWEKEQEEGIDFFNVYKQNCNGEYNKIGSVNSDAITVFEDLTSQPDLKSYSYRISAVDDCGTESILSNKHKTMHLELVMQSNISGQLIWDDYEGFPNPIFKLFVKTSSLNNWAFLRNVPNTHFYANVGFMGDTIAYSISVEKPNGEYCDAWNGNHASGGPYYQSSSNIEDEGMIDTKINKNIANEFSMYPNPANGVLNIENTNLIHSIKIFDISGKLISSYQNINQNKIRLNTQNINSGVYIIEIQSTELIKKRIIIE